MKTDLKRFKELTTGHTVVMGRKTFESIGKPLPNRRNIILTTQENYIISGCETMTFEQLMNQDIQDEVFVIGGEQIFKLFMPLAQKCYLTKVHWHFPKGDTYFPEFEGVWNIQYSKFHPKNDQDKYDHTFYIIERTG